jgi:hypothetical protein
VVEREEQRQAAREGDQGGQKLEEIWSCRCHCLCGERWAAAGPPTRLSASGRPEATWVTAAERAAAAAQVRAAAPSAFAGC